MIIRGVVDKTRPGRTFYPLEGFSVTAEHFAVRETRPDNPFQPHSHEQPELWYVIEGEAFVTLNDQEHAVRAGDLIRLDPWVRHGLRTETRVRWICVG